MSLVEQELLTLTEHLSSPPVFRGVRVTRSLVLYVCFVYRCLSFCTFSFGHCVVCSSIYGFWLPLWYLQTLLSTVVLTIKTSASSEACIVEHPFSANFFTKNVNNVLFIFTPVHRWFALSSIFPLHNCIQVCPSLKCFLKITLFCVVEKPLFLCVFIPNGVPYIFVHRKELMRVSCYVLYFSHKILIFWLFFYFIVLY